MSRNREQRNSLFQSHSADLASIIPNIENVFVCPICLNIFSPDAIDEVLVDVGHVWPKYFRDRSDIAKNQKVLLCKKCNSSAGTAGDLLMQIEAEVTEGEKIGKLGLRNIRVTKSSSFGEGLEFEAYVQNTGEKSIKLGFPRYSKKSQKLYFEEQRKKFYDLANAGPINITVYPPRAHPRNPFGDPTNAPLAQAGFLTSAYLMAFFEYGYRYILQTCLDPVREYIQQSFEKKVDERLKFEEAKDTCVQFCTDTSHYREDPEIGFSVVPDKKTPLFQEVRFLNYHIRLPIPTIFEGENRLNIMTQFLELSGQSVDKLDEVQSIVLHNMFVSNLDHPLLSDLQKLTKS